MIKEYGLDWVSQDGNVSEMEYVKIKMIQDGIELNQRPQRYVKSNHQEKEETAKDKLSKQANILKPEYVDMTYLD